MTCGIGSVSTQERKAFLDYDRDPAWRQWMSEHVPDDLNRFLWIEDREDVRFRFVRAAKEPSLTCYAYAPASLFQGEQSGRDVHRELRRKMWVYAAKKAGWPEPPPLPPYHKARKSKKSDKS